MERNMLIALIVVGVVVLLAVNHHTRFFGYRNAADMHEAHSEERHAMHEKHAEERHDLADKHA